MTINRSVPSDVVIPHVVYKDVPAAIAWLTRTFGFVEHFRYGNAESGIGVQMRFGKAVLMLTPPRAGRASPVQLGAWSQSLTLFPDDVALHYERTRTNGAKIVEELHVTIYGEKQYAVEDLEGHLWIFSNHAQDISPSDWGASVSASVASPDDISPAPPQSAQATPDGAESPPQA